MPHIFAFIRIDNKWKYGVSGLVIRGLDSEVKRKHSTLYNNIKKATFSLDTFGPKTVITSPKTC